MKQIRILGMLLLITACKSSQKIVDIPILFNEERELLTRQYMVQRYGIAQDTSTIVPKMIVLHWTAIPTLKGSFSAFNQPTLPNWRPELEGVSGLNVSSQFLVDQDGTIYRLMPETTMARHVIGLNHSAIGIENVGGTEERPLTRAQKKANIWLVHYLKRKYPIDYLIGHYEYTQFEQHALWLEKDSAYRTQKTDPGKEFLRKVKKATKNLNFKPTPKIK
ncbi:peptidoglycan recognition family protein [Arenibacter sp. GZD96]|uniref:peptidoglycan recognition protein family protein n=1 Tax=Aurantibrevibacter litoralis TaxID=3106030 RepID=UPI002B0015E5|nr:peptidoglycan recognition family protein [Arenibacter sp. GZD-96]MEA1785335.1 peptidoglycan recognition family protein [Arenibacter sp. GZD-96]